MADQELAVALADMAEVGLLRVDHRRVIREANAAAHTMLAPQVRQLIGRTVLEAFIDHRVTEMLDEALVAGSAKCEVTFGRDPLRSMLLGALRNSNGAWIVMRDVSELRRLRRIRTEFVDNLAHELRAPLTNVKLLAETLAMEADESRLSPREREALSRIEAETDHLAAMISELLDLARIEQGEVPMRHELVDLADVVVSVSARLAPFADRQGVRIVSRLPHGAAERTVVGDSERLEQLLFNLVHNAIKFSPAGGVVDVAVERSAAKPAEVIAQVTDQGPGIPRGSLERVFERFYKVDRARTRDGTTGTGLGLSIARHIVEAHGGRIWVESVEGEGASFFVALPAG